MFPRSINQNRIEHDSIELAASPNAPHRKLGLEWLGNLTIHRIGLASKWLQLRTVAIVSSHSRRNGFEAPNWQARLSLAIKFARDHKLTVLLNSCSPYGCVIEAACKESNVSFIPIDVGKPCSNSERSARLLLELPDVASNLDGISPAALIDRFMISMANQVIAIQIRSHGKIYHLIGERLAAPGIESTSLKVLFDEQDAADWIRKGAVGWTSWELLHTNHVCGESWNALCASKCLGVSRHTCQPTIPIRLWKSHISHGHDSSQANSGATTYLTHCTRARSGRWPDQSQEEYLQELVRHRGLAERRPIDALARILRLQTLFATRDRKPGEVDSVSFSAVPMPELLQHRRFEKHLGRWDWEPYGVCIKLDALIKRGAVPVRYAKRRELHQLSSAELQATQIYSDEPGKRDWRVEQEWRLFDHCRLGEFGSDELLVFVAEHRDALAIQQISRWPIIVVTP